MTTIKNPLASTTTNQYLKSKADDSMNSTFPTKNGAKQIPKKTLQQYKTIEEELEKLRREQDSQDTRLLKIQNASRRVEEDYQSKKQDVENKLMELAKRKQAFADKQKKAKEALNLEEERVKKTENKKIQEKIRLEESEKKIEDLKKEREEKERLREERMQQKQTLEAECVELKKFEDFLKEVMKRSPDFFDEAEGPEGFNVQNLISKHERIMNNKKKFQETMEQIDRIKEEEAEDFQKFKKEQEEVIMINTSKIYTLQEQIEEMNKEKSKVQGEINRIEHKTNMETSKWSQIIMSISNLHNRAQEAKDMREMEKRKEKEWEQQHVEGNEEKSEKSEKKKKDMRKWDDIRTEDLMNNLFYLEDQIKFLKDVKGRWVERKKAQESKKM